MKLFDKIEHPPDVASVAYGMPSRARVCWICSSQIDACTTWDVCHNPGYEARREDYNDTKVVAFGLCLPPSSPGSGCGPRSILSCFAKP